MQNFTVHFHLSSGSVPRVIRGGIMEPGEAVDIAEDTLSTQGASGESYCEIIFNGSKEPHTTVFYMEGNSLGILNNKSAQWPVYYADEDGMNEMLSDEPFETERTASEGRHKKDDNERKMDLGGQDDEDDSDDDEEGSEDDSDADDEGDEEDDSPDSDDGTEDDSDDDESDGEAEYDGEEDADDDGETESEETELPRLNIFAKMKGPSGWRKRAEMNQDTDRNTFTLKVGVLDPSEFKTAAQRERELVAWVDFIERDDDRSNGTLKIRLPKASASEVRDNLDQYVSVSKGGVISINVPMREDD